jgi:hypothetical protein
VHRTGQQPLEQLLLTENDHRFVADTPGDVVGAIERLRRADEAREEERAPAEERARDRQKRRERDRAGERRYDPRTFRSSAEIAGTISCRFPTTA